MVNGVWNRRICGIEYEIYNHQKKNNLQKKPPRTSNIKCMYRLVGVLFVCLFLNIYILHIYIYIYILETEGARGRCLATAEYSNLL